MQLLREFNAGMHSGNAGSSVSSVELESGGVTISRVFREVNMMVDSLTKAIDAFEKFASVSPNNRLTSYALSPRAQSSPLWCSWTKPSLSFLKINCNTTYECNSGLAAAACVVRDSSGQIIKGKTSSFRASSAAVAEAIATRLGLPIILHRVAFAIRIWNDEYDLDIEDMDALHFKEEHHIEGSNKWIIGKVFAPLPIDQDKLIRVIKAMLQFKILLTIFDLLACMELVTISESMKIETYLIACGHNPLYLGYLVETSMPSSVEIRRKGPAQTSK
ncbi:hypothetical protein V6N13_043782 [Hibiscus sabdariffa]